MNAPGHYLTPFHWREAALCVPALPILILLGNAVGWAVGGAIAAGAAFSVGFGAARELRGRRWAAMSAALLGMTIAAFVGTILGQHSVAFVVVVAAAAAGCAALALYDEDLWWVALQVVIILLVAGYYEGPVENAVRRAGLVLAGGAAQMAVVWLLAQAFPRMARPVESTGQGPDRDRRLVIAHMVRAALCVSGSIVLIEPLHMTYAYWAPMTALIVLKPRLHETRVRGLARLGGTVGGCLMATAFALLCGGERYLVLAGMTAAAGAAYALQKAPYASFTASITGTVVLLVSLGEASPLANAEHRVAATLIGGGLALAVALIFPHAGPAAVSAKDRVGVAEPS